MALRRMGKKPTKPTVFMGFVALALLFYFGGCWVVHEISADPAKLGDSFGAINALFSGFALAGVVYALILQERALEYQSEQLEEVRQQAERSKEALEKQMRLLEEESRWKEAKIRAEAEAKVQARQFTNDGSARVITLGVSNAPMRELSVHAAGDFKATISATDEVEVGRQFTVKLDPWRPDESARFDILYTDKFRRPRRLKLKYPKSGDRIVTIATEEPGNE